MKQLRRDILTNAAHSMSSAQAGAGSSPSEHTGNHPSIPSLPTYEECRIAASKDRTNQHPEPGTKWLTIKCKDDTSDPPRPSVTAVAAQAFASERCEPVIRSFGGATQAGKAGSHPSPQAQAASSSPTGSCSRVGSLPKVPELCQIMSQFQEAQKALYGQAKAIFRTTETLFSLRKELMNIHEYWMEVGMHDMAHDLLPILDLVDEDMPRYTFPPTPTSQAVAPVM